MAYVRGDSKNVLVGAAAMFVNENGPIPYLGKECEGGRIGVDTQDEYDYVVANKLPDPVKNVSYKDTLSCAVLPGNNVGKQPHDDAGGADDAACDADCNEESSDPGYTAELEDCRNNPYRNVGYTQDGIEIMFQPDFGEVEVDQVLDTVKLYKQSMKVMLKTVFVEATLENLLFAIAGTSGPTGDLWEEGGWPADYAENGGNTDLDGNMDPYPAGGRPDNHDSLWKDATASLDLASGELGECPVERGLVAVGPGIGECGDTEERIYIAYRALSIEEVTVSVKRDEETKFDVTFRLLPEDITGSYGKIVDRDWRPDEEDGLRNACGAAIASSG